MSFVVIALLAVFAVSVLVEFYKKTIRKDKAKKWENYLVGGLLSVGVAALLNFTGIGYVVTGNVWISWAIYSVVIFLIQKFLDMKVIKKLLLSALQNADIEKLINAILPKIGLTVEKIKNILISLGINKEKLIKELIENGVTTEKAEEIAKAIFG